MRFSKEFNIAATCAETNGETENSRFVEILPPHLPSMKNKIFLERKTKKPSKFLKERLTTASAVLRNLETSLKLMEVAFHLCCGPSLPKHTKDERCLDYRANFSLPVIYEYKENGEENRHFDI